MLDYAVPKAHFLPSFETDRTVTPCPHNPLGVKGVGEAGSIASPAAIVNAVVDALSPFGVNHIDMPVTSEKVWERDKQLDSSFWFSVVGGPPHAGIHQELNA